MRAKMTKPSTVLFAFLHVAAFLVSVVQASFQATGIKIGEPTPDSVIIWARTTINELPNLPTTPDREVVCDFGTGRRLRDGGGCDKGYIEDDEEFAASYYQRKQQIEQERQQQHSPSGPRGAKRDSTIRRPSSNKAPLPSARGTTQRHLQKGGKKGFGGMGCCNPILRIDEDPGHQGPESMPFAAPGSPGEVRVGYRKSAVQTPSTISCAAQTSDDSSDSDSSGSDSSDDDSDSSNDDSDSSDDDGSDDDDDGHGFKYTCWEPVDVTKDYTAQIKLDHLKPDTNYDIVVESRSSGSPNVFDFGATVEGSFRTSPKTNKNSRVKFVAISCMAERDRDSDEGYIVYDAILNENPDFFIHTGDQVYYIADHTTVDYARTAWQTMYGYATNRNFFRQMASYFMKDDHDTHFNDAWPGKDTGCSDDYSFTFERGQEIFLEQVPIDGPITYRTHRWGKLVQGWFLEARDYRDPNTDPDSPTKTLYGQEQLDWLMQSIQASDASFKIVISPTPIVGPDLDLLGRTRNDAVAVAAFGTEGEALRQFFRDNGVIVINGDRHWQYASKHPVSGVLEYGTGTGSDAHAGQWPANEFLPDWHKYVNVIGGFLSVTVDQDAANDCEATATFRFHDSSGVVRYEEALPASFWQE